MIGDQLLIMSGCHRMTDKKSRAISFNFSKIPSLGSFELFLFRVENHTIKNVTSEGAYSDSRFATAVAFKSHIIIWGGAEVGHSFFPLSCLRIGLFISRYFQCLIII